jgi:hypothetical protein
MQFRNDEITALLRTQEVQNGGEDVTQGSAALPKSCDVSYVLFLEPREEPDPQWTTLEWLADAVIKQFSPAPTISHCELVVPPIPNSVGGRVHFATYLGHAGADWQNQENKEEGVGFYLIENGSRWRALPVFGPNAAEELRRAANANLQAPYSISMYLTSARGMRTFARFIGDQPKHMGHCATITARVLKQANLGAGLRHHSAWYCPSSLYSALSSLVGKPLSENDRANMKSVTPETCEHTIDALLRGPMSYDTVRELGDSACIDALRALTVRVCATSADGDATTARIAQKQLASALLRWVLLRDDPAVDT